MSAPRYSRLRVAGICIALLFALALPALATASGPKTDTNSHRLGALPDTPDKLKGVPYHTRPADTLNTNGERAVSTLAAQVDLSANVPPVGNQGGQNSCTAWSIGYYYAGYQERVEHGWPLSDPNHQYSPAFVYNQINGGADNGSGASAALNLLKAKGVDSWAVWPYAASDYLTQPSANRLQAALPFTVNAWAYFLPGDIAGMKAWLAGGDLVSLTIPVYGNFYQPASPCTTPIGAPAPGATLYGYHQITLVGYDDAMGAFRLVNSWGTSWACGGYGWLTYDFVQNFAGYGYSMTARPDQLGILSGRVTDALTGTGIDGAQVSASGYAITTDATGAYMLAVPAGTTTASVSADRYATASQSVTLAGGVTTALDVALQAADEPTTGGLSGTVTNAATGAAVAGATVTATGQTATTGTNGAYTLGNLPAGGQTLAVSAPGYTAASQAVTVTAGTTSTANVGLAPLPGSVSGVVSNAASGAVIAGATVTLGAATTQTNASGAYAFASVNPGSYSLAVSAAGYISHSSSVSVNPGQAVTKSVALTAATGTLNVKVVAAATGKIISGATVTVGGVSGKTNKLGLYSRQLPAGSYTVTVTLRNYKTATTSVQITAGQTTSITVPLSR